MKACKVLETLGISRRTLSTYVKLNKIHVVKKPNGFYEYCEKDVQNLQHTTIKKNRVTIDLENSRMIFELNVEQIQAILDLCNKLAQQH